MESGRLDPAGRAETRPQPASGRGPVARLALPEGGAAIVRRLRRGGLAGRILPDLFAGPGRAVSEFEVTARARAAALPVPEPLGVLAQRRGVLCAVWFATRELPGVEPLSRVLLGASPRGAEPLAADPRAALAALLPGVARMIRLCHDRGLVHADLNLGNVLVEPSGGDAGPFLIDLDGAAWKDGGASVPERFANLSRLARSMEKLLGPAARDQFAPLIAAYAAGDARLHEDLQSLIPAHEAAMKRHRAGWRVSGRD